MKTKTCLQCGSEIKGRIDKKFCDDQCRTTHNNHLKSDNNLMRNINNILRKNRKIIEDFIPPEETKSKSTRKRLEEKGFGFAYHTHTYTTKAGATYYFCYEYGYLPLEHDYFMLVKWRGD
ncbi:MAG: hypothetical protein V4651_04965 [Bacteroidota bacterium]